MPAAQTLTVEAVDLEVGDVIVGNTFSTWSTPQQVVSKSIDATRHGHITVGLTIESKANGRHRMTVSRWTEYEVVRG